LIRALELMAAGVLITFSHNCVMDPWDGMGSCNMLEVAHTGLHVAQMTSQQDIGDCFNAVATHGAKVLHLKGYGLDVGCEPALCCCKPGTR
jgi:cytosine deaminase